MCMTQRKEKKEETATKCGQLKVQSCIKIQSKSDCVVLIVDWELPKIERSKGPLYSHFFILYVSKLS